MQLPWRRRRRRPQSAEPPDPNRTYSAWAVLAAFVLIAAVGLAALMLTSSDEQTVLLTVKRPDMSVSTTTLPTTTLPTSTLPTSTLPTTGQP